LLEEVLQEGSIPRLKCLARRARLRDSHGIARIRESHPFARALTPPIRLRMRDRADELSSFGPSRGGHSAASRSLGPVGDRPVEERAGLHPGEVREEEDLRPPPDGCARFDLRVATRPVGVDHQLVVRRADRAAVDPEPAVRQPLLAKPDPQATEGQFRLRRVGPDFRGP
jgi:hypothetical protein